MSLRESWEPRPENRITANSPAEASNAAEAICAGCPLQRRSGPGCYLPLGGSCYTAWRFCYTALRGNRRGPEAPEKGLRPRKRAVAGPKGPPARVFRAVPDCECWLRPSGSVPSSKYVVAVWAQIGSRTRGSSMGRRNGTVGTNETSETLYFRLWERGRKAVGKRLAASG